MLANDTQINKIVKNNYERTLKLLFSKIILEHHKIINTIFVKCGILAVVSF